MTMKESRAVWINPSTRMLKMPGVVCGGIRAGTEKIRNGYGNGDCIYFDFEHLVFAVADGSERFPSASRDLLHRLSENLSLSGSPDTVRGWLDLMNDKIYAGQKYEHKTTFSCVAILHEDEELRLIISHGGDSAVTVMDGMTGRICRQTGRDMNFAGRSREIADVTQYSLSDRNSRVIVSTDGFEDVWRFCVRRALLGGARNAFAQCPVDAACHMIHVILEENRNKFDYDDVGWIILDPNRTERVSGTVVMMGGTRPSEEKQYLSEFRSGTYDRWVSDDRWNEYADLFAGAGIWVTA